MNRTILAQSLTVLLILQCAAAEPSASRPYDTSQWIGSNYTPAYCSNQVQMWHDFRPEVIDRELAAARKYFGINTLRVYLHYIVYQHEKDKLLARIEQFLGICEKHDIRPGFVFFDDCWNRKGITINTPPPVDGRHNGRWAAVQDADRTEENLPMFKAYVQDIVRPHVADKRILWWEVYNEPIQKRALTTTLVKNGYRWIKDLKPSQPVLCGWDDNPNTDIVNAHNYTPRFAAWDKQADRNPLKGTVFTEAGARWYQGRNNSNASPIEVMGWLKNRRAAGKTTPGVYLCWELMVGNSHCRWYWGTKDDAPEPAIPWCGLLWPDCTPVSLAEAEAVRSYATGKTRAMLLEDFQAGKKTIPGWKRYGQEDTSDAVAKLTADSKLIAGDESWGDYVLEATVMLKSDKGNAGLIFRVTEPGNGTDQMHGYYAGIDSKTLYLGKLADNWQPLARADLTKLPNAPMPDAWNRIRVAARGPRIRVWLNPLHDDPGLQIDFTDKAPILKGAVGLRTHNTTAWFDDVVVLPITDLPEP